MSSQDIAHSSRRGARFLKLMAGYLGVAWILLEASSLIEEMLELPNWVDKGVFALLLAGLPVTALFSWFLLRRQDGTADTGGSSGLHTDSDAPDLSAGNEPGTTPSVAVLPFVNMSEDKDKEYFADGMTEDIITGLSRARHVSVTSRTSTFSFKGKSPDVRQVAREFGVRYVVEGSVRPLGDRIRINVQLIDAATGNHLWAEKYDADLDDLFTVQDEVIDRITARVGAQLSSAEFARAKQIRPDELSTWEAVQRALGTFSTDALSPATLPGILKDLRRAAERDPDYPYVHSVLAWTLFSFASSGFSTDWAADFSEADKHLKIGYQLARDDPLNLLYCGAAFNHSGRQARAIELLKRSLEGNPFSADALLYLGVSYGYLGQYKEAYEAIDRAEAMAPSGGFADCHSFFRGKVMYIEGRYDESLELIRPYVRSQPEHIAALVFYGLGHALAGRPDKARKSLEKALSVKPDLTFDSIALFAAAHPDPDEAEKRMALLREIWPAQAVGG